MQNCGMKPWPLPTHNGTPNDGYVPTARLRIISQRTAHGCPFVTAHNTIDHLIADHPELQYVGTSTTDNVQGTHVISSASACPARVTIFAPPAKIGGQPTKTSKAQLLPQRSLTIECDQNFDRPLLLFKHTMQPISYPEPFQHALCSKSLEQPYTTCTYPLPLGHTSCTKELEHSYIHCTEHTSKKHSIHIEDTQVSHKHIAHFSQQLQNLIVAHQLDSKSRTPIKLHTLRTELALHPDPTFVSQLIHNLQYGCNIGYTGPQFAHCGK